MDESIDIAKEVDDLIKKLSSVVSLPSAMFTQGGDGGAVLSELVQLANSLLETANSAEEEERTMNLQIESFLDEVEAKLTELNAQVSFVGIESENLSNAEEVYDSGPSPRRLNFSDTSPIGNGTHRGESFASSTPSLN